VIAAADENLADGRLVLKVALEAKSGITLGEEFFVHGAVRLVADEAAFARCFVLVNERPTLLRMAAEAGFVVAHKRSAACDNRMALVRVVAITTRHLVVQHGMCVRQIELATLVEVAIKADLRRPVRINDGVAGAAGLIVDTAGAVTAFTTHVHCVLAWDLQLRVSRSRKIPADVLVAFRTRFRTDEFRVWNLGWGDDRASHGGTGNQDDSDDRGDERNQSPSIAAFWPARSRRVFHSKGSR